MSVRYSTSSLDIFTFNGIQSILGYEYTRILIHKWITYNYFPYKRLVHYFMILFTELLLVIIGTTWKTDITKLIDTQIKQS